MNPAKVVLNTDEMANLLAFQTACRERAAGYAAAMRDAEQVYLAQLIGQKKKQAANQPQGGDNGAL